MFDVSLNAPRSRRVGADLDPFFFLSVPLTFMPSAFTHFETHFKASSRGERGLEGEIRNVREVNQALLSRLLPCTGMGNGKKTEREKKNNKKKPQRETEESVPIRFVQKGRQISRSPVALARPSFATSSPDGGARFFPKS